LSLLDWHGGMGSGLYGVGSCMLSADERGDVYNPADYHGHADGSMAYLRAIRELREMKARAKYAECVTEEHESECNQLADLLETLHPEVTWQHKELVEVEP
jgi:hypothetical protein